jgi:hypothetical protein
MVTSSGAGGVAAEGAAGDEASRGAAVGAPGAELEAGAAAGVSVAGAVTGVVAGARADAGGDAAVDAACGALSAAGGCAGGGLAAFGVAPAAGVEPEVDEGAPPEGAHAETAATVSAAKRIFLLIS